MTAPKHKGRFINLDPKAQPQFAKTFQWAVLDSVAGRRRKSPKQAYIPAVETVDIPDANTPSAIWLGHATALLTIGELRVLTDPVFSATLGPTIRRNVPVPLTIDALPDIDLVLLSHNHRDHLDKPSILQLEHRHTPDYVVPLGVDKILTSWGVDPKRTHALDWWQETCPLPNRSDLTAHLVPAQHWSQRGLLDRNASLWGGFVLRADSTTFYFVGDSGYCTTFRDIGHRHPDIDLALIPIGAYDPEWFMQPQHMNPEQALQTLLDVGADHMISIHWGTYKLTDEPLDEPPQRLEDHRVKLGIEPERIHTLSIGGTFLLP